MPNIQFLLRLNNTIPSSFLSSHSLRAMSTVTTPSPQQSSTDYTTWSSDQLIKRVQELESQLSSQKSIPHHHKTTPPSPSPRRIAKNRKLFNPSKYTTRYIALKFAYLGSGYNGFEHHANNTTPLPTVEEELWKALVKCRLIFPPSLKRYELLGGDVREKLASLGKRKELGGIGGVPVDWEGCRYSKCGRTDRGVSAFGQVIALNVRSAKRRVVEAEPNGVMEAEPALTADTGTKDTEITNGKPQEAAEEKEFDHIADELPYISMLNNVLPQSIRILAWCPNPPGNFDARFSCREREYRYFFTSPAYLPQPGGHNWSLRTLNIEAMREAATYLLGTHDFRNMCKLDGSKQLTEFNRSMESVDIDYLSELPEPKWFAGTGSESNQLGLYAFKIRGSAFLWHQVRCMVAILFLVGQGLEQPSIVKELLDIEKCPTKPLYDLASDAPLVLWNCKFSAIHGRVTDKDRIERPLWDRGTGEDELEWLDSGGPEMRCMDGKWEPKGVMEDLWKTWRAAKMDEILASQLLDLAASPRSVDRPVAARSDETAGARIVQGDNTAPYRGIYVPLLKRNRMDSVETMNSRYAASRKLLA